MKNFGFTLIELSIVLVIIGLIVGGVLVGQDLIKAAEQRAVVSEITQFNTAANTFRLKYNGLPGDLKNATAFFSSTCNGDGDKQIDFVAGSDTCTNETLRVWQQLSQAGLIDEGGMTGILSSTDPGVVIGENITKSSVKPGGYMFRYYPDIYTNIYGNKILFAQPNPLDTRVSGKSGYLEQGVISSLGAYNIDTKMDDGFAQTGTVITFNGWDGANGANEQTGCVSGSGWLPSTPSTYVMTNTAKTCRMTFEASF